MNELLSNKKRIDDLNYNVFENKKNIIIDLDGTLIDSLGIWNEVDREVIIRQGKIPRNVGLERDNFLAKNTHGNIYLNYAQYNIDSYGLENITAEELMLERNAIAKEYQKTKLKLKENAADFLKLAREFGYILTLATITSREFLDYYAYENPNICNMIDLYEIFNGGTLSKDEVSKKKPNPEVYEKAMVLTKTTPDECIVIEDSLSGIVAAKGANLDTIVIYDKYSDDDREKINELANYTTSGYKALKRNIRL